MKAYETGNYTEAYDEWLPLARSNDPAAMRNIGHLYRRGLGVEQNFKKALSWYKQAAEMGFDRAQANLATMYLKGEGVDQNYKKASEWFSRAARNGHTIAQYNLGLMYEHGKGVSKSTIKALGWYNLAAKAGHKLALDKLSVLVASDPDIQEEKPKNLIADPVVVVNVKPKPNAPAPAEKSIAVKPAAKPKELAPPKQKETLAEENTASAMPKAVVIRNPEPMEKSVSVSNSPAEKQSSPAVVANKTTKTEKRWDPFAGSANNSVANSETLPKGETTVFSQPKKQEVKPASSDTVKQSPVKQAKIEKPKQEEKQGFFAALKSLIAGDEKEDASSGETAETQTTESSIETAEP
ncbi:MAG: sel1 repeat family protein [Sneathiella sp.]|nr:sel1 repeat family protein [Sneathiella sp.]